MNPVRRLVTKDDASGRSRAIFDGAAPDVREEYPGILSSIVWATDRTPARIAAEPAKVAADLAPPPGGSLCRIVTFPARMKAPARRMRSLDFCLVLEGEITLILDLEEVHLKAGDVVVQRATRHAWSNRSGKPCVVAISSHDAAQADG